MVLITIPMMTNPIAPTYFVLDIEFLAFLKLEYPTCLLPKPK